MTDLPARRRRRYIAAWVSLVLHNILFAAFSAPVVLDGDLVARTYGCLVWLIFFLLAVVIHPVGVAVVAIIHVRFLLEDGGRGPGLGLACALASLGGWVVVVREAFSGLW